MITVNLSVTIDTLCLSVSHVASKANVRSAASGLSVASRRKSGKLVTPKKSAVSIKSLAVATEPVETECESNEKECDNAELIVQHMPSCDQKVEKMMEKVVVLLKDIRYVCLPLI